MELVTNATKAKGLPREVRPSATRDEVGRMSPARQAAELADLLMDELVPVTNALLAAAAEASNRIARLEEAAGMGEKVVDSVHPLVRERKKERKMVLDQIKVWCNEPLSFLDMVPCKQLEKANPRGGAIHLTSNVSQLLH